MLDYKGLNFLWNFFRLENLRWRMVNDIYKQYFWAHCTDDNPKAKKFISHCTHIYLWFLNFLCITGNCMKASVLWCFENISKYLKLKAWYMIFCCVLNKITNLGYFELSIFFFFKFYHVLETYQISGKVDVEILYCFLLHTSALIINQSGTW